MDRGYDYNDYYADMNFGHESLFLTWGAGKRDLAYGKEKEEREEQDY